MTYDSEEVSALVKQARAAKGLSQPELARRVGTTQQTIDKIETGKVKTSSFLPAIAVELGIPIDRVLKIGHRISTPGPLVPGATLVGDRDLPVYAATPTGTGAQILSSDAVEYVARPEPLARVRDGYGVIVVDDSIAPEFRSGDIALVNPHLPPRAGDTCVFRRADQEGTYETLRHLRRITDKDWLVSEWSDDGEKRRDYSLKRAEWPVAHVTVGNYKRR
jgi:transcriptional regulator with XRE-family HTH domain